MTDAAWTILIAAVCNVSCAILGCFLVLRRMSLLGDAISHAVLPGIALAFYFTGQVTGLPILLGAMLLGLITAWLTEFLSRSKKVNEDASLGIVFTSLFALGIILILKVAKGTDLDAGCVLYGNIETTVLDLIPIGNFFLPHVLPTMLVSLALVILFVMGFWKELKISSFDPSLALTLGKSPVLIQYLLLSLVAGVSVSSFEAVGAMLVVSMLVVPAATARMLSDSLYGTILWACLFAVLSSFLGYYLAVRWDSSVSGAMALSAGALFLLVFILSPKYGIITMTVRRYKLTMRITEEDLLGLLYRREAEGRGNDETVLQDWKSAKRGWLGSLAIWQLYRQGLVSDEVGVMSLTESGRAKASELIRIHRLWESYLEQNMALPKDHLHAAAHRAEHYVGPELREELEEQLDHPQVDPQGRVIPKG